MSELTKRRELANESMNHNLERMGIILISVCSGGVYVCVESIKFSKEQHLEKPTLIIVSGILFVLAILFSFFSHNYVISYTEKIMIQYYYIRRTTRILID